MATIAELQAARAAAVAAVDRHAVKVLDAEIARLLAVNDGLVRERARVTELDGVLSQYGGG